MCTDECGDAVEQRQRAQHEVDAWHPLHADGCIDRHCRRRGAQEQGQERVQAQVVREGQQQLQGATEELHERQREGCEMQQANLAQLRRELIQLRLHSQIRALAPARVRVGRVRRRR